MRHLHNLHKLIIIQISNKLVFVLLQLTSLHSHANNYNEAIGEVFRPNYNAHTKANLSYLAFLSFSTLLFYFPLPQNVFEKVKELTVCLTQSNIYHANFTVYCESFFLF